MNFKRKVLVAVLLVAAVSGQAQADGWRGQSRHGFTHHRPVRVQGGGWIAPLIVLGIAGAAISAAARGPAPVFVQAPPPPVEPVVVYAQPQWQAAQPMYVAPAGLTYAASPQMLESAPGGIAYYCPALGQYHPQVQSCPSGWQLVDVTR